MAKSIKASDVKKIVFVCEAGIGSSLMSVNSLKKKFRKAGIKDVTIEHSSTTALPSDTPFIVCHKQLMESAKDKAPDAVIVGFDLFFNDPVFDELTKAFEEGAEISETEKKKKK
jgi:mannitol-specific phosphotransferase system IIBC component